MTEESKGEAAEAALEAANRAAALTGQPRALQPPYFRAASSLSVRPCAVVPPIPSQQPRVPFAHPQPCAVVCPIPAPITPGCTPCCCGSLSQADQSEVRSVQLVGRCSAGQRLQLDEDGAML